MALKGMTKIDLTNVKTGEVETVEKHNMVTNALKSVLSNPFGWQTKSEYNSGTLAGNLMPICPNVIGGILLYESQIPEDPNQIYAQPGNVLVGYANNEVNNTEDTMRGSININESGPLESGDGYRFVFDFNTSQGNGTIGAVGLTSKFGGRYGPDSNYVEPLGASHPNPNAQLRTLSNVEILKNMVSLDEITSTATAVRITAPGSVEISRICLNGLKNWKLSADISLGEYSITEVKTINPQYFCKKAATQSSGGMTFFCNFCDDHNGYIWGLEHKDGADGNESGKANINWIKINIESLDFTEGTWEIDAQLYRLGHIGTNGLSTGLPQYVYTPVGSSAILDGELYCFQKDKTKIVKISISNTTDVRFIDFPLKISSTLPYKMCTFGNVVYACGGYINGDAVVPIKNSRTSRGGEFLMRNYSGYMESQGGRTIQFGTHAIYATQIGSNNSGIISLRMISAYLATINNLPAPVEKTADKTMKITYIIREETET